MNKNKIIALICISLSSGLFAMHDAGKGAPDEAGLLGALGNASGISLIAQIAHDSKQHDEQRKEEIALDQWREEHTKSKKSFGFEKFFVLPYELQIKILKSSDLKYFYALRHKRALAPFMVRNYCNARDILNALDYHINLVKQTVNTALKQKPKFNTLQEVLAISGFDNYLDCTVADYSLYAAGAWNIVRIYGYSDRTYEIVFNDQQFKAFIDSCSLDQLLFLISLARTVSVPEGKLIRLSCEDYAVFQTFDMEMQILIENRYSWIDFYNPIIENPLGLDERLEQIQSDIGAWMYSWAYWISATMQA